MKGGEAIKQQALREWRRGAQDVPRTTPKSVGQVIEKLLPKLGLKQQVEQNKLVIDWAIIVGGVNSKHSKPSVFRDGVLIVSVDHSAWRMEFEHQKPLWLRKVREYMKPTTVKEIVFRVEG